MFNAMVVFTENVCCVYGCGEGECLYHMDVCGMVWSPSRYRHGIRGRMKAVILELLKEYYRVEEAFQGAWHVMWHTFPMNYHPPSSPQPYRWVREGNSGTADAALGWHGCRGNGYLCPLLHSWQECPYHQTHCKQLVLTRLYQEYSGGWLASLPSSPLHHKSLGTRLVGAMLSAVTVSA